MHSSGLCVVGRLGAGAQGGVCACATQTAACARAGGVRGRVSLWVGVRVAHNLLTVVVQARPNAECEGDVFDTRW